MALTVLANLGAGTQPLSIIDGNFNQCNLGPASSTVGAIATYADTSGKNLLSSSLLTRFMGTLGADVALNNITTYFDGPSVAQGSVGTWYASGTVTLTD